MAGSKERKEGRPRGRADNFAKEIIIRDFMAEPLSGSREGQKRQLPIEFSYWRDVGARVLLTAEPTQPYITLKFIGLSHCPKGVEFADWQEGDWISVRLNTAGGKRHLLATHLRESGQAKTEEPKRLRTIKMSEDLFRKIVGDLRFPNQSL